MSDELDQNLHTGRKLKIYANGDIGGGIDLVAAGGTKRACRMIVIPAGAGTLIVTDLDGDSVTLPGGDTDEQYICAFTDVTGGTATSFHVYW